MSILLQPQLFSFDDFVEIDNDNCRLALVLWMLPDTQLLRWPDDLTVRGKQKVRVHVSLALLVMRAGAAAMAEEGMLDRVRQTVRLAA